MLTQYKVFFFDQLVTVIFFALLIFLRTLTLQLLLLLGVLFSLSRFISTQNVRMASSINSVSPSREFYLNNRMYNILGKIRDRYIEEKDRDRNEVL